MSTDGTSMILKVQTGDVYHIPCLLDADQVKRAGKMYEESKGFMATTGGDRVDAAKDTFMVFPGIVKIYKDVAAAKECFSENKDLTKVIFSVTLETDAKSRPMDAKLFLAEDSQALATKNLCDGLMQRLVLQINNCTSEDGTKIFHGK
jgi:hypothetical protein